MSATTESVDTAPPAKVVSVAQPAVPQAKVPLPPKPAASFKMTTTTTTKVPGTEVKVATAPKVRPVPVVRPGHHAPGATVALPAGAKPAAPTHIKSTVMQVKKPTIPAVPNSVASAAIATPTKSKSKKKKNQPTVVMATATTAQSGGPGTQGENTGRWTAEEHRLFLQGLEQHGKGWKKIASLIKSRTVVQIRTHAQKYFQKLAKARQNGEEGDVSMEGRGGPTAVTSGGLASSAPTSKRRRQTTGTKRKAISSVVSSAQREGKKIVAAQVASGVPCPIPPLPAVAPALAPFVVPTAQQATTGGSSSTLPSGATSHGAISGPALEDSLYVYRCRGCRALPVF